MKKRRSDPADQQQIGPGISATESWTLVAEFLIFIFPNSPHLTSDLKKGLCRINILSLGSGMVTECSVARKG